MRKFILIFSLLFCTLPALAYEEDFITDVFSDGEFIKTTTGLYRSLDPITSCTWLPTSDVIITDDGTMYNVDDEESVDIIQLR